MTHLNPQQRKAVEEVLWSLPWVERQVLVAPHWRELCHDFRHQMVWLYAFQAGDEGPVKIGFSNTPHIRLRTLQRANPDLLRPRACWKGFPIEEKQIHDEYAEARLRGEWFRPVPELLQLVDQYGDDFQDWDRK